MPRRLPWKTSGTSSSVIQSPKVKTESPRPLASRSPSVAAPAHTPNKKPRRERVVEPERFKSPSTSPPPEPPAQQFMITGPHDDDRYRMVEDEFLNIAHQFTTHLHRAEYNRLKSLAKSQNAATIREIERPTVGPQTLLARRRQESVQRVLKQRKLKGSAADEGDVPWKGTSLQGLLESPRKEAKWISAGVSGTATTRAAAGYRSSLRSPPKLRQPPQVQVSSGKKRRVEVRDDDDTTDGDDDDDLATPSRRVTSKPALSTPTSSSVASRKTWPLSKSHAEAASPRGYTKPTMTSDRSLNSTSRNLSRLPKDTHGDEDGDDPFGINKRRIRRIQSKEQVRKPEQSEPPKKRQLDTIPSFYE